ncbi:ABC transporter ATP-binding protein [Bacillus norwichensis]|uniref:ABC transporter ATP-binding protein n=1 Tax=Bacillus norwichensis TaxID=2762217 RepID=A0ABR8VRF3_9BACI|nr:ABC transporter ATP-binding protein [Bacillus norwichensis]MBD8007329.1 ABC transporter ATP-binding protein [Bacillus norwichensis]
MSRTIHIKDVTKSYGEENIFYALKNITLSFKSDEITLITGPSGSGKSTLLNIISTLESPASGDVFYDSKRISHLKADELANIRSQKIGFVFQQFHLLPNLTAMENVIVPLLHRKVDFDKQKKALEMLESIGLADKAQSFPSQLSGGQQQRVAIARALVTHPDWILADEPTGNLDSVNGQKIYELLSNIKKDRGCGIIIITHDPSLMEKADRVIELKDGMLRQDLLTGR